MRGKEERTYLLTSIIHCQSLPCISKFSADAEWVLRYLTSEQQCGSPRMKAQAQV